MAVARSSGGIAICYVLLMDDVMFGHNGPYGNAWKAEPLNYCH